MLPFIYLGFNHDNFFRNSLVLNVETTSHHPRCVPVILDQDWSQTCVRKFGSGGIFHVFVLTEEPGFIANPSNIG